MTPPITRDASDRRVALGPLTLSLSARGERGLIFGAPHQLPDEPPPEDDPPPNDESELELHDDDESSLRVSFDVYRVYVCTCGQFWHRSVTSTVPPWSYVASTSV